jgi:cobalt-zinc-cadmium resistance protein CzcA
MIKRIVSFALHQPLFIVLMVIIFIGGGVAAFVNLPIEAFPDVSDIQVNVITLYPGRAPEEVEKQVTIPLETALNGMPHAVRLFSHTQFGLSYIVVTFDDHTTDMIARQQTLERLTTVDVPPDAQPQLQPLSTAIGEIFRYRVKGDGYSTRELRTLQDWVVDRNLRGVPGVADIDTFGGLVKTYEVNPDLAKMRYYGIPLSQLYTALGRGNANVGGSKVTQGAQQFLIRGVGMLKSADEIKDIVLVAHNGTPVLVKDIATVTLGNLPVEGIAGQDKDDDIVFGIVDMHKGDNPSIVLKALKAKVAILNNSILPQGVKVVPYYDRAWLIRTTLHTVFENLATGAILVTFVLLLFLGNVRAAMIVAVIIPLALLATFIGLTWRGIPANLISLGAMDFGIIVDGAVIVVENVFRRLGELKPGSDKKMFRAAIEHATVEVGRPTFFSMLIIIAAHIPIFTLQRTEGRIFAPMAWTITSALIGSLIFSLTLVPVLCMFLLRKKIPHEENALVRFIKRPYVAALRWALVRPKFVIVAALAALVVSLGFATRLGTEFLPELNEGSLWVNADLPASVSVEQAREYCRKIRGLLHKTPEVNTVVSKSGRPEDGTDPKPINMAEVFLDLKPPSEWRSGMTQQRLIDEMSRNLATLPGIDFSIDQPIMDNVLESISQIDGQVVVKVFGDDSTALRNKAKEMCAAIADVRGVDTACVDRAGEIPQTAIEIDRQAAARYGLNIGDIEDVIQTGLGGKAATEIWEGEKHFSIVVRLPEAQRSLTNLKKILVDTPDGLHIPLEQVATFKEASGSMNISREDNTRFSAISVFIKGRDMGGVVADMQTRLAKFSLPHGWYLTWGGEFESQQRAMKRLSIIVPISIFLIFVLLFDAFKSVKSALLILVNVPMGLIGGIFALLLTGIPLSVSGSIGFIALFGQAVLNGVVMVSCFNQLQDEGLSTYESVFQGAVNRLRTVLMTALLAILGLLPMALSHGIGSETQRPLAIVIIGGLVSATLLTLIVLPVLYLFVNRNDDNEQAAAASAAAPKSPSTP